MWWMVLLVFIAMVALDFCYGEYTKACAERRVVPASNWAVALYLCGVFVAINVIDNNWMCIPAAFGSWLGTYVSIRHGK
jgi:hypothetical protein